MDSLFITVFVHITELKQNIDNSKSVYITGLSVDNILESFKWTCILVCTVSVQIND